MTMPEGAVFLAAALVAVVLVLFAMYLRSRDHKSTLKLPSPSDIACIALKEGGTLPSLPPAWRWIKTGKDANLSGVIYLQEIRLLRDGEAYISGQEMLRRAQRLGSPAGARCAEELLKQSKRIPGSWRVLHRVWLFAGSVMEAPIGRPNEHYHYVKGMAWDGNSWYLCDVNIDNYLDNKYRLVLVRRHLS